MTVRSMYTIYTRPQNDYHNPILSFGTKLNAVLTNANTVLTTIKLQSSIFCERPNSAPNSFR